MCADVSTQPWVPGKYNVAENATNESEETGKGNATANATNESEETGKGNATANATESVGENQTLPVVNATGRNLTDSVSRLIANRAADLADVNATDNESQPVANRTAGEAESPGEGTTGRVSTESENLTYAAYHPIQYEPGPGYPVRAPAGDVRHYLLRTPGLRDAVGPIWSTSG